MTYSCTDFADSILSAFQDQGLILDPGGEEFNNSPGDQADLVLDGLANLIKQRDTLLGVCKQMADLPLLMVELSRAGLYERFQAALKPLEPATKEYESETSEED